MTQQTFDNIFKAIFGVTCILGVLIIREIILAIWPAKKKTDHKSQA